MVLSFFLIFYICEGILTSLGRKDTLILTNSTPFPLDGLDALFPFVACLVDVFGDRVHGKNAWRCRVQQIA